MSALACAVACGLALAGCGDLSSSGGSAADALSTADRGSPAASAAPATAIPDDFPLSAGMGGPEDVIETARTGTGLRDLAVCGTTPLRGLGNRDRMVADNSGGEAANTRELVLLGNPDEAALVAESFADLGRSCEADTVEGQPGMQIHTDVRTSPFRPAPAATLVQTYTFDGRPGTDATVIHVVPVGASLLVTSTYGQWTEESLEDGVAETVAALRDVVAAQATFEDGVDG
jgi:hypothetical protein